MRVDINTLIEIIADSLEMEAKDITEDTNLLEDLEINSIAVLEIIAEIEDIYNVKIQPDMIKEFTTVKKVAEVINNIHE